MLVVTSLALVLSVTVGCSHSTPQIVSVWPAASTEATIVAPAGSSTWPLMGTVQRSSAGQRAPIAALYAAQSPGAPAPSGSAGAIGGVGSADVVYEWGSTRTATQVLALFQSSLPADTGALGMSNASAHVVAGQYAAVLCSLGGGGAGTAGAVAPAKFPGLFGGTPPGGAPGVYLLARKAGTVLPHPAAAGTGTARLFFGGSADSTQPIASITVPVAPGSPVTWEFQRKEGSYLRTVQGDDARDSLSGKVISVRNLLVMWARPVQDDSRTNTGQLSLTGQGQVSVFRDGVRSAGHWLAPPDGPPRLTADDGSVIPLAPGSTWFEIVPLTANITLK